VSYVGSLFDVLLEPHVLQQFQELRTKLREDGGSEKRFGHTQSIMQYFSGTPTISIFRRPGRHSSGHFLGASRLPTIRYPVRYPRLQVDDQVLLAFDSSGMIKGFLN